MSVRRGSALTDDGTLPMKVTENVTESVTPSVTALDTVTTPSDGRLFNAAATKSAESQGESDTVVARTIAVTLTKVPDVGSTEMLQSDEEASGIEVEEKGFVACTVKTCVPSAKLSHRRSEPVQSTDGLSVAMSVAAAGIVAPMGIVTGVIEIRGNAHAAGKADERKLTVHVVVRVTVLTARVVVTALGPKFFKDPSARVTRSDEASRGSGDDVSALRMADAEHNVVSQPTVK